MKLMKKQTITEEMKIHKEWYKEAEKITEKTLPKFISKLINNYNHDYGTICHACSAAAIASINAVNNSRQGGITGFQAGCIMWGFIKNWMPDFKDTFAKLTNYKDLLYPQYEDEFNTLSKDAFEWLQKEAKEKLETSPQAHPEVVAHWKSIVDGKVPFGLKIKG